LMRVVNIGERYCGRVLWGGSGGLASALAAGTDVATSRRLLTPILGVFGSDHAATAAQLERCFGATVPPAADGGIDLCELERRLAAGVAFLKLNAPAGSSREQAARHFEREVAALSRVVAPPRTLIISGGATLRAQCLATGAHALRITGRLEAGIPRSVIEDGAWRGVEVISKSGAFGSPDLWWKVLSENALI
jgi:D-threonate/D-erythronate kinase